MSTYNKSLIINAAISSTAARSTVGVTGAFTNVANGYAIINFAITSDGSGSSISTIAVRVGGQDVHYITGFGINEFYPLGTSQTVGATGGQSGGGITLHVGPSQQVSLNLVSIQSGSGTTYTLAVSGVQYVNSS